VDGEGTTLDEAWLPEPQSGDEQLDSAIDHIASGAELRPGSLLSEFSIAWVVVEGDESPLDEILESQLDLVPTPLATGAKVFENPDARPVAAIGDESVWRRDGTGFTGVSRADQAVIRVSYSHGWQPEPEREDWFTTVSAAEGEARFGAGGYLRWAPYLAAALLFLALGMMVAGRLRR
jgi:hypothetical protein